jgi:hypothetical protein
MKIRSPRRPDGVIHSARKTNGLNRITQAFTFYVEPDRGVYRIL